MSTRAITRSALTPSVCDDFFKPWNEWFVNGDFSTRILTVPAVNIVEDPKHYEVSLAAPGLKKEDFQITVEGNMLTVHVEKEQKQEEEEGTFSRREYSYTSFSRNFSLPEDVKQEDIEAKYQDGILSIRLPRRDDGKRPAASKQIAVN